MPLQSTSGSASYDAFGGGVAAVPKYIEEYFSTFLFKGNASTQTITNGIDLSVKGGLVWTKSRTNANEALIYDTVRGVNNYIIPSSTQEAQTSSGTLTAFNSNGFTLGANDNSNDSSTENSVSWSIAKSPKFFDVVTATTNGSSSYGSTVPSMTITHSLGSVPGCVIVKRTDGTGDWYVWHRSLPALSGLAQTATYIRLNTTGAAAIFGGNVNGTGGWIQATATHIYLDAWFNTYEPGTFIVYILAHDAGGFGLTGTDNVISCGSFTTDGSGYGSVTLGYEPQWILMKDTQSSTIYDNWYVIDNMRGFLANGNANELYANKSDAENANVQRAAPTATGFIPQGLNASKTYIYIAIRRGPMKVPTSGTSVYETVTSSASAGTVLTTGFPVDLQMQAFRSTTGAHRFMDRLRGVSTNSTAGSISLASTSTAAETTTGSYSLAWNNTGFQMTTAFESTSGVFWNFRRAPSFFDEVCYTGNSTAGRAINHNLGVAPELLIVKRRSGGVDSWYCYAQPLGNTYDLSLDSTRAASNADDIWYSTSPTSTTFTVRQYDAVNGSGYTYVAYLFATCAGVSKVGSYTGTGTTKQVDCGFTGGARFVLIKRTDSTGDWYVWDTARGIVSGNDPYLLLNSTAAEVTSTDYIDTYSAGFEISSTAPAAINASGGTFIFLAIA